jgi:hypothetical protein
MYFLNLSQYSFAINFAHSSADLFASCCLRYSLCEYILDPFVVEGCKSGQPPFCVARPKMNASQTIFRTASRFKKYSSVLVVCLILLNFITIVFLPHTPSLFWGVRYVLYTTQMFGFKYFSEKTPLKGVPNCLKIERFINPY